MITASGCPCATSRALASARVTTTCRAALRWQCGGEGVLVDPGDLDDGFDAGGTQDHQAGGGLGCEYELHAGNTSVPNRECGA